MLPPDVLARAMSSARPQQIDQNLAAYCATLILKGKDQTALTLHIQLLRRNNGRTLLSFMQWNLRRPCRNTRKASCGAAALNWRCRCVTKL